MARSRTSKRQSRALNTMQEKGIGLCALGMAFLVIPKFMGSSPVLNIVAAGLRIPGWLALAAGLALLGIHRFTKAKITQATPTTQIEPEATATHRPETSWSPAVFTNIEWRRFEAVCEKLFGQAGFETKSQSHGADGGVDISTAGRGF